MYLKLLSGTLFNQKQINILAFKFEYFLISLHVYKTVV